MKVTTTTVGCWVTGTPLDSSSFSRKELVLVHSFFATLHGSSDERRSRRKITKLLHPSIVHLTAYPSSLEKKETRRISAQQLKNKWTTRQPREQEKGGGEFFSSVWMEAAIGWHYPISKITLKWKKEREGSSGKVVNCQVSSFKSSVVISTPDGSVSGVEFQVQIRCNKREKEE